MTTEGVSKDAQLFRKVRLEKDLRGAMGVARESKGGKDSEVQVEAAGVEGGTTQAGGGAGAGATAEILQLLRSIDERVRRLEEGDTNSSKPKGIFG